MVLASEDLGKEEAAETAGGGGGEELQVEAGAETDPLAPRGEEVGRVGAEGWVGEVEDDRHARIGEAGRVRAGEAVATGGR